MCHVFNLWSIHTRFPHLTPCPQTWKIFCVQFSCATGFQACFVEQPLPAWFSSCKASIGMHNLEPLAATGVSTLYTIVRKTALAHWFKYVQFIQVRSPRSSSHTLPDMYVSCPFLSPWRFHQPVHKMDIDGHNSVPLILCWLGVLCDGLIPHIIFPLRICS